MRSRLRPVSGIFAVGFESGGRLCARLFVNLEAGLQAEVGPGGLVRGTIPRPSRRGNAQEIREFGRS